MGIGFQIKSALRERKMTLRQLADETGISYNTLYSVTKRDNKRMDCVLLSKISAALELPVGYFTGNIERAEPGGDATACPCSSCTIRPCESPGLCCRFAQWLRNPVAPCASPESADVGSRIKYYRKQNGLTQEGLAQAIGVTGAAVARYENGSREPRISTIAVIANVLGIQLVDLIGGNDNDRN